MVTKYLKLVLSSYLIKIRAIYPYFALNLSPNVTAGAIFISTTQKKRSGGANFVYARQEEEVGKLGGGCAT